MYVCMYVCMYVRMYGVVVSHKSICRRRILRILYTWQRIHPERVIRSSPDPKIKSTLLIRQLFLYVTH